MVVRLLNFYYCFRFGGKSGYFCGYWPLSRSLSKLTTFWVYHFFFFFFFVGGGVVFFRVL